MVQRALPAAAVLVILAMPARAMDCPVEGFVYDQREAAVKKAATCKDALEVMSACSYGASGDVGLGEVVTAKCEADFAGKLSKAQQQAYDRGINRCDAKYAKQSGTMYRSMAAFCRAELAQATAVKFAKAPQRR